VNRASLPLFFWGGGRGAVMLKLILASKEVAWIEQTAGRAVTTLNTFTLLDTGEFYVG